MVSLTGTRCLRFGEESANPGKQLSSHVCANQLAHRHIDVDTVEGLAVVYMFEMMFLILCNFSGQFFYLI